LADEKKAGGMKDIKDLKARLGLAKGGAASAPASAPTAGSGSGQTPAYQPGGVPPPMGGRGVVPPPLGRGALPAPPGFPQPEAEPAAPPIDARHDPFGAMAQQARAQATATPQVIVPGFDDGRPIERVQKTSTGKIVILALISVIPLVIGYFVGGVVHKNKEWNRTVADGKVLYQNFKKFDAEVAKVGAVIDAKRGGDGRLVVQPDDEAFNNELDRFHIDDKDMQGLKKIMLNSNYRNMEQPTVDSIMSYYLALNQLYVMVQDHVKATKNDLKFLQKRTEKLKDRPKYAAFFRKQAEGQAGPPFLEIVQLADPICTDEEMQKAKCLTKAGLSWNYRMDAGQPLVKLPFANLPDVIAPEVLIPVSDNRLFVQLGIGAEPHLAAEQFVRRLQKIDAQYQALKELRKRIDDVFQKVELVKKKRFSF